MSNIFIFAAVIVSFILSIATRMSNFAFASILLIIVQCNPGEHVIFKKDDNIYYISDMSLTPKKINGIDFLKNRKQQISAASINITAKNNKKFLTLPVTPREAEEIQKILI